MMKYHICHVILHLAMVYLAKQTHKHAILHCLFVQRMCVLSPMSVCDVVWVCIGMLLYNAAGACPCLSYSNSGNYELYIAFLYIQFVVLVYAMVVATLHTVLCNSGRHTTE